MKFTNDEYKLVTLLAVSDAENMGVRLESLEEFFERPARLLRASQSLERWGMVSRDIRNSAIRLCDEAVLSRFLCGKKNGVELFTNGEVSPSPCVPAHKGTEKKPGQPKAKPPDPPPKNAPLSGDSLRSLPNSLPPERPEDRRLKALKEEHKGIKPLMGLESLREALLDVESGDEETAYRALCGILGGVVMEGGDRDRSGQIRIGDGGKWRNRWRTNRTKTHRVMAALVEELNEGGVKSRGGRAQFFWEEFSK